MGFGCWRHLEKVTILNTIFMLKISSKATFFFILVLTIVSSFFYKNWKSDWFIFNGDSLGYYTYLPAVFIHNDIDNLDLTTFHRVKTALKIKQLNEVPAGFHTGNIVDGKRLIQYTSGIAILQMPFFCIAHAIAKPLGYEADGYSQPYKTVLFFGNIFYVMLGLWYVRKILSLHSWGFDFSELIVSLVLFLLVFATNLYYFTVYSGYMSHSYLFALFAFLIWHTMQFYAKPNPKTIFLIGFLTGLIALIRPLDGLIAVVPLLYGIFSWTDFKARLQFFINNKTLVTIGLVGAILPILPQLFYWKHITGHWIFNSYLNQGFVFKIKQVRAGLIGFKNGWLPYTPIMFFALIGIYFMWKKKDNTSKLRLPLTLFLPTYICLIYFWWCFNYINGFGSRPMIDTYALLAIPLSICIEKILKKPWVFSFWLLLAAFFTWLNVIQTYQMTANLLASEESNATFWWVSMGKTQLNYQDIVAFDSNEKQPLPSETTLGKVILSNNFEDTTHQSYTQSPVYEGKYAGNLKAGTKSPTANLTGKDAAGYKWIKVKGWFYAPTVDALDLYNKSRIVIQIMRGKKTQRAASMSIENRIHNIWGIRGGQPKEWGYLWFYVKIPSNTKDTDTISAFIENTSPNNLFVDNLQIELHN
jgi:hypothetical protein